VLLALCSALLEKSLRGGLVIVGSLNLGGGVEPVYNAVTIVELAVEKGASTLLMPCFGAQAAQRLCPMTW
jgi:ATP-dependent Lon protease